MSPSESTLVEKMNSVLEEMLAMGYIVFQTGNFNKAEGILSAAQLVLNALAEDCSPELIERYKKLDEMIQSTQTCCDWVI